MGILKDCKIKIKNFLKKLKKSVDKVEKQPYNKTRSAEGKNSREIESKEETQKEQRTLKIKQRTRNPKMTLS